MVIHTLIYAPVYPTWRGFSFIMPKKTDNTLGNRLKTLPAPGHGTITQRVVYALAPLSFVLSDVLGYRGDAPTHCGNLSADTVRGLIALGFGVLGYSWPALWPRLARHLDFDDSDEVADLKKQLAEAKRTRKVRD